MSDFLVIDGHTVLHAVEVGAGDSTSSQCLRLDVPLIQLVEPNMILAEELSAAANAISTQRITVHACAVGAAKGMKPLVHMGYASYLLGAPSFLATSVEPGGEAHWGLLTAPVPVITMDQIDNGSIDLLVLTCGGSEVDCLTNLRSRPVSIRTKHYLHNERQGEVSEAVVEWMRVHGYKGLVLESNLHSTHFHIDWRKVQ